MSKFNQSALILYKKLFNYTRRYWFSLVIALAASILYSGIDAWFVYFLKPLLNKGLVGHDKHFLNFAPILVLLVFSMRGIASFFSNYNIASVARKVIMKIRQDLFAQCQTLPSRFYDKASTGDMLSVLLYNVEQVANASADVLTTAIQASFLVLGLLVVMFSISWKLSLLYFIIIPLISIVMRYTSKRVRRLSLGIQDSMAWMTRSAEENIMHYKTVRAFGGQNQEIEKFNTITNLNRIREMKVVAARAWSVAGVQVIAAMALSVTLYVATVDIKGEVLSAGGFVAMIAAMLALLKPMKDLTTMQNKLYRGLAGAESVFKILDETPETNTGHLRPAIKGQIQIQHVCFQYENAKTVLNDISISIKPNQLVALVGRSGSGKSTLVQLLLRFYEGYTGKILIDGVDISEIELSYLRQHIAFVSQHVTLFNDTVTNNIAYGLATKPSHSEIQTAAEAAHALEFIKQLPNGFDTVIGENGILLSGGQRQRLAIARAILRNAPILILDEATSALDSESEFYIQQALESLMQNRTTIVIAHRLSTIQRADTIVVMEEGKMIEMGNHVTLIKQQGSYAKLYNMDFAESEGVV